MKTTLIEGYSFEERTRTSMFFFHSFVIFRAIVANYLTVHQHRLVLFCELHIVIQSGFELSSFRICILEFPYPTQIGYHDIQRLQDPRLINVEMQIRIDRRRYLRRCTALIVPPEIKNCENKPAIGMV